MCREEKYETGAVIHWGNSTMITKAEVFRNTQNTGESTIRPSDERFSVLSDGRKSKSNELRAEVEGAVRHLFYRRIKR